MEKERKDGMKDERKDELSVRRAEQGGLNAVSDSAAQHKQHTQHTTQHNNIQYFTAQHTQNSTHRTAYTD